MLICRSWVFARAWSLLSECRWNWTYSKQAIMEQMSVTFLFLPSPNSKLSLSLSLSLSYFNNTHSPSSLFLFCNFNCKFVPPTPQDVQALVLSRIPSCVFAPNSCHLWFFTLSELSIFSTIFPLPLSTIEF
jgi:hypothetical protein